MTRVDFYILPATAITEDSRWQFTCRLVEKARAKNTKLVIQTPSENVSNELDALLWQHKPESFIPHEVLRDSTQTAPVLISHTTADVHHHDALINLTSKPPVNFSQFERLIEVVTQNPESLKASRKNFTFYKSRGYLINTHKL